MSEIRRVVVRAAGVQGAAAELLPGSVSDDEVAADAEIQQSKIAGLATALNARQPLDPDLSVIAALDSSQSGAIVSEGSGWLRRSFAQLVALLPLSKTDVGLANVDNTSDVDKPVSSATADALTLKADLVGGLVPSAQLPGFVDDILEFADVGSFPVTGESGKIYIAADTSRAYRWTGSTYGVIPDSIALGETSSSAYRGDRGKVAYDHSQLIAGNPHNVTKTDVGLSNVDNTSDANKPISTAAATAFALRVVVNEDAFLATKGPQAVDNTGATRADIALQAAYDAAAAQIRFTESAASSDATIRNVSQTFKIPSGRYQMQLPLQTSKDGPSIELSSDAELYATSVMDALLLGPTADYIQRRSIVGGHWNCNGFAKSVMVIPQFVDLVVTDIIADYWTQDGFVFGDDGSGAIASYELELERVRMRRPRAVTPAAGKAAIWMRRVTDSNVLAATVRGTDIGIRVESPSGNNTFERCHIWNPTGSVGPSICFDDAASGSMYDNCYADTPSLYGFRVRNDYCVIDKPRVYLNAGGSTDVVTAFYLDGSPQVSISKGQIRAVAPARFLRDINTAGGGSYQNLTWEGMQLQASGITTRTFNNRPVTKGLYVVGQADVAPVQLAAQNNDVQQVFQGGVKRQWTSYQGALGFPKYTTTERNALKSTNVGGGVALSSVDAGLTIYNSTNERLETWNGSVWKDQTGAVA
jgi:hypothetical protein